MLDKLKSWLHGIFIMESEYAAIEREWEKKDFIEYHKEDLIAHLNELDEL